jgi:hypothetical protein
VGNGEGAAAASHQARDADGKTALLLLDFGEQNCGVRPRCMTSLPKL